MARLMEKGRSFIKMEKSIMGGSRKATSGVKESTSSRQAISMKDTSIRISHMVKVSSITMMESSLK